MEEMHKELRSLSLSIINNGSNINIVDSTTKRYSTAYCAHKIENEISLQMRG